MLDNNKNIPDWRALREFRVTNEPGNYGIRNASYESILRGTIFSCPFTLESICSFTTANTVLGVKSNQQSGSCEKCLNSAAVFIVSQMKNGTHTKRLLGDFADIPFTIN